MVARSLPRCSLWLGLAAFPPLAVLVHGVATREQLIALACFGFFGLQGFVAEYLGVRADGHGVSFPSRVFAPFGFPVFWRRHVEARELSRVDAWGSYQARLFLTSGNHVDLELPSRHAQKRFLRYASVSPAGSDER
jgi:hypothetical protein